MDKHSKTPKARKAWQEPRAKHVGQVGEILQGGEGKLSPLGGDPGEMRVPKPGVE